MSQCDQLLSTCEMAGCPAGKVTTDRRLRRGLICGLWFVVVVGGGGWIVVLVSLVSSVLSQRTGVVEETYGRGRCREELVGNQIASSAAIAAKGGNFACRSGTLACFPLATKVAESGRAIRAMQSQAMKIVRGLEAVTRTERRRSK